MQAGRHFDHNVLITIVNHMDLQCQKLCSVEAILFNSFPASGGYCLQTVQTQSVPDLSQLSMNFNCSWKIKCWKIKNFLAFKLSDVVFITLINVKMPTFVGILTFMSVIHFMLSWVEHEKSLITSGPDLDQNYLTLWWYSILKDF